MRRVSGVTSVDEARRALGLRLRELRRQAKLTGRQLADSLSWPASKISKLENGRQNPTEDDLRAWAAATGTTDEIDALLASLHTLETRHAEWIRQFEGGLPSIQARVLQEELETRLFRVFCSTIIPGLAQTADYARARLAGSSRYFEPAPDIDEAIRLRLQRQEQLYRADKRFHFVLTEGALRCRMESPEVLLAQLDRLVSVSTLPTVRLGIIGYDTTFPIIPWHGFWIHDNDKVIVETFSAELNLAQPQEINLYSEVFEQLAAEASYGGEARAIIQRVMDELSTEVEKPVDFEHQ